jgi:MYXO-CTERM domain-containing protein
MTKHLIAGFAVCVALLAAAPQANAQSGSALYDPATGNITLTLSSGIAVAGFGTEPGSGLSFNIANDLKWGTVTPLQKEAAVLAYFDIAGLPAGTNTILGALPTLISGTNGKLDGKVGFSITPIGQDPITISISVGPGVPEPATCGLAGASLLALAAFRRRRG